MAYRQKSFGIKLQPRYDSRKSFYGKAVIRKDDGRIVLRSYATDVAEIVDGKPYVYGTYSPTTLRHIKEFLRQHGFKAESSKQIMKDYGATERPKALKVKKEVSVQPSISSLGDGKVFKINDRMEIHTDFQDTRTGFRHNATLMVDGNPVDESTAHYLNRTWESYEYQSVVDDLINKTLHIPKEQKESLKKKFQDISHGRVEAQFKTIGTIAKLGEVFAKEPKDKIAWKLRMIKAGLGEGFQLPEDWDKLSNKEKEARLDKVIAHLRKEKD